ncbi:rRNA small subunit methyltransferase RsmB [Rubidibacter lacunae KORDI 51-2]|uniref:16S rRNA (cytosine(967)-C(5))-methyltransferase n=1 Tax=Rubidibacter lacunae KORDI 51-2 TaxID=582515 RepID=U5DET1_9CHRO|nr:16S rRNA (cytosine(967)-C(5))-methyltransferase [Rubidibacter lacunae]ERN43008.1 rRNA small subunit methyltransferase RsmB [Rubidibacter lacunae KORDI 51-2]
MDTARFVAFRALEDIDRHGAYPDIALDRALRVSELTGSDRGLTCELVYGCVRRQRTLDAAIDWLGKLPAAKQPPDLRRVLHLGLYQLRYLDRVPGATAVNTSVELAKTCGLGKLSGVVNGMLRSYLRQCGKQGDPLPLPDDAIARLGTLYSFPDWIVQLWRDQHGLETAERLCAWFDRPPTLDLRVNLLRSTPSGVAAALDARGVKSDRVPGLPQALRLRGAGDIRLLPGFEGGWWSVQDAGAQLAAHFLDPQPEETIVDACAAPGGKTTHIAELMGDRGTVWACDRDARRLRKVEANAARLRLGSIRVATGDFRATETLSEIAPGSVDRVLVDAPCSGLGTLHRRADLRWRQSPEASVELAALQVELLAAAATWVKPGGILVYATCTVHPAENDDAIAIFCERHPHWQLQPPPDDNPAAPFIAPEGWVKILPCDRNMDGFFLARLQRAE